MRTSSALGLAVIVVLVAGSSGCRWPSGEGEGEGSSGEGEGSVGEGEGEGEGEGSTGEGEGSSGEGEGEGAIGEGEGEGTPSDVLCENTCALDFSFGGCDDGYSDPGFSMCAYGTDCSGCGPRTLPTTDAVATWTRSFFGGIDVGPVGTGGTPLRAAHARGFADGRGRLVLTAEVQSSAAGSAERQLLVFDDTTGLPMWSGPFADTVLLHPSGDLVAVSRFSVERLTARHESVFAVDMHTLFPGGLLLSDAFMDAQGHIWILAFDFTGASTVLELDGDTGDTMQSWSVPGAPSVMVQAASGLVLVFDTETDHGHAQVSTIDPDVVTPDIGATTLGAFGFPRSAVAGTDRVFVALQDGADLSLVSLDAALHEVAVNVSLADAPGTVESADAPVLHVQNDGDVRWVQPVDILDGPAGGVVVDVKLAGTLRVFSPALTLVSSAWLNPADNTSLDDVITVPGGVVTCSTDGGNFIILRRAALPAVP